MGHPPRIPLWLRWDQSVVYFVTICAADRKPVLANKKAFQAFKVAVSKLKDWRLLGQFLCRTIFTSLLRPRKSEKPNSEIFPLA
jgi:hypothetical protein